MENHHAINWVNHGKSTISTGPFSSSLCNKLQGLVNVLIEHHPNIGDIIFNRYLKVMFKIPKMGHLPNPKLPEGKISIKKSPSHPRWAQPPVEKCPATRRVPELSICSELPELVLDNAGEPWRWLGKSSSRRCQGGAP